MRKCENEGDIIMDGQAQQCQWGSDKWAHERK